VLSPLSGRKTNAYALTRRERTGNIVKPQVDLMPAMKIGKTSGVIVSDA
jgi:hypothetical protein